MATYCSHCGLELNSNLALLRHVKHSQLHRVQTSARGGGGAAGGAVEAARALDTSARTFSPIRTAKKVIAGEAAVYTLWADGTGMAMVTMEATPDTCVLFTRAAAGGSLAAVRTHADEVFEELAEQYEQAFVDLEAGVLDKEGAAANPLGSTPIPDSMLAKRVHEALTLSESGEPSLGKHVETRLVDLGSQGAGTFAFGAAPPPPTSYAVGDAIVNVTTGAFVYDVSAHLETDSFAEVFLAARRSTSSSSERHLMRCTRSDRRADELFLMEEGRALANIGTHPHLQALRYVICHDDHMLLFYDAPPPLSVSLDDLLCVRSSALLAGPPEEVCARAARLLFQLADACQAVHAAGYLVGDLQPAACRVDVGAWTLKLDDLASAAPLLQGGDDGGGPVGECRGGARRYQAPSLRARRDGAGGAPVHATVGETDVYAWCVLAKDCYNAAFGGGIKGDPDGGGPLAAAVAGRPQRVAGYAPQAVIDWLYAHDLEALATDFRCRSVDGDQIDGLARGTLSYHQLKMNEPPRELHDRMAGLLVVSPPARRRFVEALLPLLERQDGDAPAASFAELLPALRGLVGNDRAVFAAATPLAPFELATVLNNLGVGFKQHRRNNDAGTLYRAAMGACAESAEARFNMGVLLRAGKKYTEAGRAFKRAAVLFAGAAYGDAAHEKIAACASAQAHCEKRGNADIHADQQRRMVERRERAAALAAKKASGKGVWDDGGADEARPATKLKPTPPRAKKQVSQPGGRQPSAALMRAAGMVPPGPARR